MTTTATTQGHLELASGAVPPRAETAVSVIVPVCERPEPLAELYREYASPLQTAGYAVEFVFVAEPWFHELTGPLHDLAAAGEPVRVLEVGQATGETSMLQLAASHCRSPILLTLPAYRRIEAAVLPHLVAQVERGSDLVVARRWPRRDPWVNRLQTSLLHGLLGGLVENRIHDIASGVRAMRRELLDEIPLYGDFYRFLPLLALREGYRVDEVSTPQHGRDTRTRFYTPGVYLRRLLDVLGLFFVVRFTEKPLRFFGLVGGGFSLVGGLVLTLLALQRLGGQGIADRPLLLFGVLLLVLGIQAIALGLIGEIIVHLHAPRRRPYRLARTPKALR